MKIFLLAPQPFFQERGTPIAVRLAAQVLAQRKDDVVDLLTYHEGVDVEIPNLHHTRISIPRVLRSTLTGIGPGISFKKLLCDIIFAVQAFRMVWANRAQQYDLIHAVEESAFVAWAIRLVFGIPYIYDMDSSLAMQLTEKWYLLKPLNPIFRGLEKLVVRGSTAVVPVCDALAVIADQHGSRDTHILRDISLLDRKQEAQAELDLRSELKLPGDSLLVLYIGNLEPYQGIDLLVDGFARAARKVPSAQLVIIGGIPEHIRQYRSRAEVLGIENQTHLLGPRPVTNLNHYLPQADVLASPRLRGNNTPMKIYSYLHSGRVILATDLPTHRQVLTPAISALAAPTPKDFGSALLHLLQDPQLRSKIGAAAQELAEREYTYEIFERRLNELYDRVGSRVIGATSAVSESL